MSLLLVGVLAMLSHYLSSNLSSTCTYLHPVILRVCFISLASAYDGGCTRRGESAEQYSPEVLLAVSSCRFPDHPSLPLKPAAADCRACLCCPFCLFITQSARLFCSIKLTPTHIVLLEWSSCCCCDFAAINTDITSL